jgi:hypothetical protein
MFKYETTITNCTLSLPEQAKQLLAVELKKLDGKKVVFKLEQKRNQRSLNQNKYYWGCLIPTINQSLGYNDNEANIIHELLKEMFLGKTIYNKFTKTRRKIVRSTSDLTTLEMEDYLTTARTYMSGQHNIYIPLPHEYDFNY